MASRLGPSPIPVLRPQKPLHMPGGDGHRGKSLKLLEKIPEDAEATVVLVGEQGWVQEAGHGECPLLWSVPLGLQRRLKSFPLYSQFPAILASLIYSTIVRIRGEKRSLCDRHPYFLRLLVTAV